MTVFLRMNFMGRQVGREFFKNGFRCLNFVHGTSHRDADNKSETDDHKTFTSVFPHIVRTLTYEEDSRLNEIMHHFKEVLEYNVADGKKNRGIATLVTFKILNDHQKIASEQLYLASVMGWCIELLQAFFLISDDVMDQSYTRRGKPCWFRKDGIGLSAINDGIQINAAVFKILKIYFGSQPYYHNLMELFHEAILKTCQGQSIDLLFSRNKTSTRFDMYTPENYATLTEHKTSHYSFYLPVASALHMSGITDPNTHAQAREILVQIGHYFQVQDDFLDCFGNPAITGKMGTDIQEGKCTWLIVTALRKANITQLQLLKDNYGCENAESIQRVKKLYQELEMPQLYTLFEQDMQIHITNAIKKEFLKLPVSIFEYCLKQIYKRNS